MLNNDGTVDLTRGQKDQLGQLSSMMMQNDVRRSQEESALKTPKSFTQQAAKANVGVTLIPVSGESRTNG
jgi:hypothetical protein